MALYILQWLSKIPLITYLLFIIYIVTAILKGFFRSFIDNYSFVFKFNSSYTYVTSFFYFGRKLSIPFIYELILFVSYSKALENHYSYTSNRMNYLFCLFFGSFIIILLSKLKFFVPRYLSRSLVFYIICLFNNHTNPNGRTIFLPALVVENKYMTVIWIFVSQFFSMFEWSEYFLGLATAYLFIMFKRVHIFRN